jgi:hypothetical protein
VTNGEQRFIEKHFFWMPSDCEMYLAALTAMQDYLKWLDKRSIDIEMSLYCTNPLLSFLDAAAQVKGVVSLRHVSNPLIDKTRTDYDQAIQFDPEIAYQMSLNTEKHVTQMFGIALGSEPSEATPILDACIKMIPFPGKDILILPFPGSDQLAEFIFNNHPDWFVTSVSESTSGYPSWMNNGQESLDAVCDHQITVGVRSGITYLAASARRGVVEIYPKDRHRNWLSKWSNPFYHMIYGNAGEVHSSLVYRSVETLYKKLQARKAAMVQRAEANAIQ